MDEIVEDNGVTVHLYDGTRLVTSDMLTTAKYTIRGGCAYLPSVTCRDFDVLHALITCCEVEHVSRVAIRLVNSIGIEYKHYQICYYERCYSRDDFKYDPAIRELTTGPSVGDVWVDNRKKIKNLNCASDWYNVGFWILGGRILKMHVFV